MQRRAPPGCKVVHSKGHEYVYFKTSRVSENGKPIYIRLPPISNKYAFGAAYAAAQAGLKRKPETVLTVRGLYRLYEDSPKFRGLAHNTQKLYMIYLGKFVEIVGDAPADKIERRDVAKIVDERGKTPSAGDMIRASVSALYRWGRERGHVTINPARDIGRTKPNEHQPWPDDLLAAALKATDDNVRLATALLYYTGQRIGDVTAMRWSDIKNGVLFVTQEKTGTALEIPIHPFLQRELDRLPRGLTTILAKPNGKPYDRQTIRGWLQAWSPVHIVAHGLRKNAVNALLEAGCSTAEVSSITGQSLQQVEHYAKARNKGRSAKSAMAKWGGTDMEWENQ